MKNLITSIACTVLLMAFLVQFAHHQVLFQQIAIINHAADLYADEMVIEADAELWLKEVIVDTIGCGINAVEITKDDEECIISFPVSRILASPSFWGISKEDNSATYVIRRRLADS